MDVLTGTNFRTDGWYQYIYPTNDALIRVIFAERKHKDEPKFHYDITGFPYTPGTTQAQLACEIFKAIDFTRDGKHTRVIDANTIETCDGKFTLQDEGNTLIYSNSNDGKEHRFNFIEFHER